MKNFNLGTTLSVRWSLTTPDGEPFSLAGYTYTLRYKAGRGSGIARTTTIPIGADGEPQNKIIWSFSGQEQTSPGIYDLELSVYASGNKISVINYVGAFSLERMRAPHPCCMAQDKNQPYGHINPVVNTVSRAGDDPAEEIVDIYSVAEWWAYKPVEPTAGTDGFWYVNGVVVTDDSGAKVPTHLGMYYDDVDAVIYVYDGSAYVGSERKPKSDAKFTISAIRDLLERAETAFEASQQEREEAFAASQAEKESRFTAAQSSRASIFNSRMQEMQSTFEAAEDRRNAETGTAAAAAYSAASEAKSKGDRAQEQGDRADSQGTFAKRQGDYAKEQGDYAKAQGEFASEEAARAEHVADTLEDDIVWKSHVSPATPAAMGLVKYTPQDLTFDQQIQARRNIGAASEENVMHKDGEEFVEGEKTFVDGIMVPFDMVWRMGHDKTLQQCLDEAGQGGAPLVPITYAELVSLRNNGGLAKGVQYRITDYNTSSTDAESRVMNHQFDIIVVADSTSILNENARAIQHDGDTYFTNSNLAAWELKYSLDNNASKYGWADTNGKGVIYYMKDEWENECPYDFKNIQFKRYKVTTVTNAILNEYVGKYIGIKTGYGYTIDSTDFKWFYTLSDWSAEDAIADASIVGDGCGMNRFDKYRFGNVTQVLNNNTIVSGEYVKSLFPETWLSEYSKDIANNNFKGMSYNNSVFGHFVTNTSSGGFFRNNTIYGSMRHNDISTDFQENAICGMEFCWNYVSYFTNNIIGSQFSSNNLLGGGFKHNIVHNIFRGNTSNGFVTSVIGEGFIHNEIIESFDLNIGTACEFNVFHSVYKCSIGNTCTSNEFTRVSDSTFGNEIRYNKLLFCGNITVGNNFTSNWVKGQVNNCTFGSYTRNSEILGICSYISTPDGTSSSMTAYLTIKNLRGAATSIISLNAAQFKIPAVSGLRRHIDIEASTDGKIVATWKEGFTTKGIYKDSATDTTWKAIPE